MKHLLLLISLLVFCFNAMSQDAPADYMAQYNQLMERTQWWREARFGMFIHFGAYAVPARGEWVKSVEELSNDDYQQYVENFKPVDYDPKRWAKLAKEAGMKYVVMTAKHHDGFCLFDSKHTNYKVSTYMPDRDLVREYLDAFRAEGLKVGLYYSLIDWHHPDYPHYGDNFHPMRANKAWKNKKHDWDNYLTYMHNQVDELVSNYGKLDIMWFDFSYGEMNSKKWQADKLIAMVRQKQPDIILDNRLDLHKGVEGGVRQFTYGDFATPEQGIPEEAIWDQYGNLLPWETCLTLNNNWGYSSFDDEWKSPEMVVHALVNCVSKGGNLLLNVGPDARGRIPEPSVAILKAVGKWMSRNGESIYGCGPAEIEKPDWGRYTQNGNQLYAHWLYPHIGHLNIKGYADKTEMVTLLRDGSEVPTATQWFGNMNTTNFFINVAEPTYKTYQLPDSLDTVFKLLLK